MPDVFATAPIARSASQTAPDEKPRSKDPHLGLCFWVQLGQVEIAGFRECTGLTIETETFEYAEGGLNTYKHKLPVRTKYTNIVLKRGLDEGQDLFRWYVKAMNGAIKRQDISIIVYDSQGREIQKWDLQRAYPCKWTGPSLNAEKGSIAVETVEIAHEGLLPTVRPRG
jgi:phage tail-like protein